MDSTAAKTEQATAKRLFTMANKQLMKSVNSGASVAATRSKFEALCARMESVMSKHALYLALQHPDDADPTEEETKWMEEIEDQFSQAEADVEQYCATLDQKLSSTTQLSQDGTQSAEWKKKKRLCQFEMESVESMLNELTITVKDETAPVQSIKDSQGELKDQMERYRSSQRELVLILDSDEDLHNFTTDMKRLQHECSQLYLLAGKAIEQRTPAPSLAKRSTSKGIDLKMERMKMPNFTGDIREYPRFKADFDKHVRPNAESDDAAAYILKSCLGKEALDTVKNVDDDLDTMWERLDDRYGRSSKIVDAVMHEIKQLKAVPDGDGSKFIHIVNTIESCYLDLKRISMEHEICNSTIVSLIEERLPPTIKSMWCLEVSDRETKVTDTNKFQGMLEFMLKHKRAIEYGADGLRSANKVQFGVHLQETAPLPQAPSTQTPVATEKKIEKAVDDSEKRPPCWLHPSAKHSIVECRTFNDMTPQSRLDMAYDYRVCWCCLQTGHPKSRCFRRKPCMKDGCKQAHHPMLHLDTDQANGSSKVTHVAEHGTADKTPGFLQIMILQAGIRHTMQISVLWDSGAQVSLITHKKARELGLSGTSASVTIVKIGNVRETINTRIYEVPIVDSNGEVEMFQAYGIPQISSGIEAIQVDELAKELDVNTDDLARPTGEIEMLIGYEYAGFHPERIKSKEHLLLLQNKFGKCLGGAHRTVKEKTKMVVQSVQISHASVSIEEFFSNESLGVSCTPKCGSCRCGECPVGSKQYTLQQERELALIDNGLTHADGRWTSRYPWIKDPTELPDNYPAASSMLNSLERRLMKNATHMQTYKDQIQDMIDRNVAEKIDASEMSTYPGPVYYLSHHEVLKPDSESTPCRIVFNSSSKFRGHVLNEYWAKGPDMLNNLLGVLIRFREDKVAVAGDIRKMYHSVSISELDQHTHRFMWRDMDMRRRPDVYKITRVSFGDKPAGSIAALALKKTAQMSEEEFPEASTTIRDNTYVDDILGSLPSQEKASQITSQIDDVLRKGGFEVKAWTISATDSTSLQMCPDGGATEDDMSKVLGVVWSPKNDTIEFVAKVNFSPRHRKIRTGPDLTISDMPRMIPEVLTKRMVLSLVNGIFDPLGLSSPFVVQAKMLLRKLTKRENIGWDDPIPTDLRGDWISFFTQLFDMEKIVFRRSTKPNNAIGEPTLILFSDASEEAFGACAYVRWQIDNGKFQSNLLAAKSRLSPNRKMTIPRLELNGALLAARLSSFIQKETVIPFSRVFYLIDSEIVRAQIQRESYGFNTFSGVRIGEIQELTEKNDWYWVEGAKNIADIVSRGAAPSTMGPESEWQNGPSFLEKNSTDWPIKQTYSGADLPDQVSSHKSSPHVMVTKIAVETNVAQVIHIERYSSYPKLLRMTARIHSVYRNISLRNIAEVPNREQIKKAELMWIRETQRSLHEDIKPQTMKRLGAHNVDGICIVGSRLEKWAGHTYNNSNPILLSSKSEFAQLYVKYVHSLCHLGTSAVAAKVRAKFWIVGLRKLLRSIRFKCVTCKRQIGRCESQIMGQLPEERTKPAPQWSYVSLDLFGPFPIRGEANKRTRSRGYGLIIDCLLTRAIHLDVVCDYSTKSFLMALRRFMSVRGCPSKIYSDQGSQLRAADKELREALAALDEEALKEFSSDHSFEWEFCSPNAPWQNGCSESLIKSVKKSLKIAIGDQALTFSEFQTVLMECANLLNDRPIAGNPTSPDDGVYLSPNDILLGHSTTSVPQGPFNMTSSKLQRFKFVQRVTDAFWRRWTESYFPSLLIQQKWHASHRNLQVGDVVIVQDSNLIRGKWRFGRVMKADPSLRDGFVRNVDIQYKNVNSKNFLMITRPVQRVIVLVPAEDQSN